MRSGPGQSQRHQLCRNDSSASASPRFVAEAAHTGLRRAVGEMSENVAVLEPAFNGIAGST